MDEFTLKDKQRVRYVLIALLYLVALLVLGVGWLTAIAVSFSTFILMFVNINRVSIERVAMVVFWLAICVSLSIIPNPSELKAGIYSSMNDLKTYVTARR